MLESYEYYGVSAGSDAIYPLATDTVYRSDYYSPSSGAGSPIVMCPIYRSPGDTGSGGNGNSTGSGTGAETTSYAYTWFPGTVQAQSVTATLPATTQGNQTASPTIEGAVYNLYGQPTWTLDADGNLTYTAYDEASGAVIESVADAIWEYGPNNGLPPSWGISDKPGSNFTTTYQVDALGRTTKETDPDGDITYTVYDDVDREVRVYPGWNPATDTTTGPIQVYREDTTCTYTETLTYAWNGPGGLPVNAAGAPTGAESLSSPDVTIESLSRTLFNDAGQDVADLQYTDLAGLVYSTAPILGTKGVNYDETDNAYGPWGELTSVADPLGHTTACTYDANGNLIATTDPLGNTTRSVYNNVNQLVSVTDADGNTTTFTYDMFGNVASQTNALGDTTSYVYDDLGNLLSTTDADGRTTAYQYNAENEETAENWLDASGNAIYTITYGYDANGDPTSVSDPAATYTYTNDGAGRTTSETDTIGKRPAEHGL